MKTLVPGLHTQLNSCSECFAISLEHARQSLFPVLSYSLWALRFLALIRRTSILIHSGHWWPGPTSWARQSSQNVLSSSMLGNRDSNPD